MKTRYLLKRITAMILLAVLCLQPVEFAFAQTMDEPAEDVLEQPAEQPVDEPADVPVDEPVDELAEEQAEKQIEESPAGVTLISIEVTKLPAKTEYLCTDTAVDPAGGILTLAYSDGSTETVELSSASLSALSDDAGEVSVTASYEGMTASFAVSVSHSYDDGVVTTESTATEAGVMTYTCVNCGDEQTSEIPMAVSEEISGTCGAQGNNLTWTLSDGVLTISGSGAMAHYTSADDESRPWIPYLKDIRKIVVGSNVDEIDNYAFSGCSNVESLTVPFIGGGSESDMFLGYVFGAPPAQGIVGEYNPDYVPGSLKSVTVANADTIGIGAFENCTSLESVDISGNVSAVGDYAFYGCSALKTVSIPDSATSIGNSAFYECASLTGFTIPDDVTVIGESAFSGCRGLETVNIPENVKEIKDSAFYGLVKVKSISIPNSVTAIGADAFGECYSLEEVNIPTGIIAINDGTFISCMALKSVVIPENITSIGRDAFYGCSDLGEITFEGDAPTIGDYAFTGVTATAYYNKSKNWTSDDFQDYGGTITWKAIGAAEERYITDISRIATENVADYELFEGSKEKTDSDGNVFIDMKAQLDYLFEDEKGYRWMHDVNVVLPDDIEGIASCTVTAEGVINGEIGWSVSYDQYRIDQIPNKDKYLIGISIPFKDDVLHKDDSSDYRNVEMFLEWKDSSGNILAVERFYCEITKAEAAAVEDDFIYDPSRFTIDRDDNFNGSFVSQYPDGVVVLDMRAKVNNLYKDTDGYFRTVAMTLSGGPAEAVYCDVTAEGVLHPDTLYTNTDGYGVTNGTVTFTVPFTEEVVLGENLSGGVNLKFAWKDRYGRVIKSESACCEIVETFSYINDTSRFSLAGVGLDFAGSRVEQYEGAYDNSVYLSIKADTDVLTPDEDYYYIPDVELKAPKGATFAQVIFLGFDDRGCIYEETFTGSVYNGLLTMNIPFTKDVMGNMEYGGNRIEMRIRWMDSGRNFMQHERAFCVFETQSKYIDDVWRFEIVNALEFPGVMSSSKVVQYPDGVVCLDMKVDMDEMELGQDDFYWLYDIILTAPSDEAVSCDIDHIGVRNRETIFHGRMTDKEVVEHNGNRFIGFNTHFVEELLCTDRNYGNVELHFTWKDKNGSELLREIAYMEVSEAEGFDNIDGLKADWYEVNIPESLRDSVTVHKQDGLVTITVGEATAEQWAQAYIDGRNPEATTIIASIHVTGPADAEYYYDVQGGMEYESYMERTAPDSDGWRIGRESGNGEAIAQIVVDEDGYTFVPMGNMEYGSKHRYLAWKNANNEVTRAILQQNIVVAEGVDKVEVGTDILPLPAYPEANRISYQGNDWFTDAQYNAENGTVTFNCTLAEGQNAETLKAAIAEDNSQGNVTVWVKPPEGYDKVRTSWGYEFIVGEGGVYDFGHTYWYWEDWEKGIITLDTGARTVTVTWLSSVDLSLPPIRETITIRYNFSGMYWMDKYWQPVPVERIKLPTIAGLTFDVVDGGIHTRVDGDVIPDAEKLRYAEAVITPPKGARGLKFNHSGGTATADYSDPMADEQDMMVRTSHVGRLADGKRGLINIKELEVDGVTVVFNERLGGEDVSIFDWYDNARCEGEPILREYIWQTEDALLYTSESDSVENEEDIKEPVKKPTLVGAKGWKLKLHRYSQKNENREHAFYFRLEIKNGKGDSEGPGDKKWVVYLPFDFLGEGVDTLDEAMNKVKGNKKITINHYDENHNCIEVIEGKITKNGIRFKAKSFSPLMVSVEEGGSAAAYVSMVFDSMGGTPVESVNQILIGSTVQLPEPEKDGYDLVGWFTEPECGCELECGCVKYTSETPVLENVTLYARWARASVAVPNASIASGTIVAPGTKVSLMAQGDDVSICYSIGVTGFMESDAKLYGEPIEITEDTTINAIARMDGYEDSEVVTFTYTVEQPDNSTGDVLPEDMPTTPGEAIPEGIWVSRMADLTYDGTAQKPAFRLYDGNKLLEEKVDYTVSYKNNTKAAEADVSNLKLSPHIIVKMKGNYTGEIIIPFTIKPVELNADDFTVSIPAQAETGKALTPKPTVTWNKTGKAIKLNTDYTIEHSECKEPGKYSVTIKGAGNFEGVLAAEFIVANKTEQVLMSKVSVASIKAQNWEKIDGGIKPELLVTYKAEEKDEATGKNLLYEGVDYTVEWVNNDRVGTASVILTGTGEDSDDDGIVYVGSVTKTFKINGIAMSKVTVNNVAKAGYEYTGSEIRPTEFASDPMTLTYQADKKKPETWKDLTENTHYTVEYQKNVAKGTGTVIFTGKEEAGYTGTKKQTFKINAAQLNADTAVVNIDTCAYTAGGAVPSMLVMWKSGEGDVSLVPGVDYTVSFKNNKAVYEDDLANAKKAPSVTIKGKGNFAGTIVEYFHISPKLLDENCGVTVVAADKVDTGKAGGWQQSFKVYDSNGKALSAGKDYEKTAEYRLIAVPDSNGVLLRADRRLDKTSVVRPGSVIKVTVRGVGSYQGCVSGTYRILEKGYDIKSATIQIKDQLYTGKEIRITDQNQFVEGKVFIKVGKESIPLELGKDIQVVSYEKNLNKGSAKVTFAGVGKFGGTKTVTFKIIGYAVN